MGGVTAHNLHTVQDLQVREDFSPSLGTVWELLGTVWEPLVTVTEQVLPAGGSVAVPLSRVSAGAGPSWMGPPLLLSPSISQVLGQQLCVQRAERLGYITAAAAVPARFQYLFS